MGTKNKNLRKNRLNNKRNTVFRNTLNAFLDDMVTILITNTFQNRILELMNNIDLPIHINYFQNLLILNITNYLIKHQGGRSNFTGSGTENQQKKLKKSKPIMSISEVGQQFLFDDNNK